MRLFEDFSNDLRIKKYGDLAEKLRTSQMLLTGRRATGGIKIEELMVKSEGDFSKYQELIKKSVIMSYDADFLDFSLLMGKFFGVYNEYCYIDINRDVKVRIISNEMINKENTMRLLERKFDDIYEYLRGICVIDEKDFISFLSSLFVVRNDNSLYNDPLFKELASILLGNALIMEKYSIQNGFAGSRVCVEYFKRINNLDNSRIL